MGFTRVQGQKRFLKFKGNVLSGPAPESLPDVRVLWVGSLVRELRLLHAAG